MSHSRAQRATVKANKIVGKPQKVKFLSHSDIQHLYIDLHLTNRSLAARLSKRDIKVSGAYVGMLLRKKALGKRPFGEMVLKAIAEELGIDVAQLKPDNGGAAKG